MRNFISIICFCIGSSVMADGFTVFEKDGYFGIKDQTGNVTVPPVYEKLGWSDGSSQVVNGVIGFRKNNLWGLITVRNKSLTGQRFYTIQPIANSFFKASIKGKFSNHLFHGVLDEKGKTIISFNYFTIEPLGANWLVSAFDGHTQRYGVVSFQNELLIPTKYKSIMELNGLYLSLQYGGKRDLFSGAGQILELGLDSLISHAGYVAYRDGFAGYLSDAGEQVYGFDYKSFDLSADPVRPIPFPEWTIHQGDSILMKWKCDSLTVSSNGLLAAYLNGAPHLLLKNSTLLKNHDLILKEFIDDHLIIQNSKSRKWSVLNYDGSTIFSGYDSIHSLNDSYAALNEKGWWVISQSGKVKNKLPFQKLKKGDGEQYIIKKNNHWGILNKEIEEVSTFKYDSISLSGDQYVVNYLNRTGLMNREGSWIVRPEYHSIFEFGEFVIGQKGKAYTYFSQGRPSLKTTSRPIEILGSFYLVKNENGYGLLNAYGEYVVYPEYDSIRMVKDHLVLQRNQSLKLITSTGETIISPDESYQEISNFSEGYFVVKKENRWGFVDDKGRLRISNRYDSARSYQEGMAPIMLREKWGFIDKNETLRVQPYYDQVDHFQEGVVVVRQGMKYGLIDMNGREVLELIWKTILRLDSGNYLVQDINGHYGLVDNRGGFILRPAYDYLEDFGGQILVSKNGYWGILDYSGRPIFKINHKAIKVSGDLTMIRN
ncbi:WG repeat-containing protein [Ekhidna sp.]|uniref:WG repeat-containing protein n=1 Tax=Ekhidna sp. TaxID=2608089 RepID=UPI003CCC39BA